MPAVPLLSTQHTQTRAKGILVAAITLAATAVLSGCVGPTAHQAISGVETRVIETATGELVVATAPERVIALDNTLGALLDVGIAPVATVETPANLTEIPTVGAGLQQKDVDIEQIAAAKPDLIVGVLPDDALNDDAVTSRLDELRRIAPLALFSYGSDNTTPLDAAFLAADAAGKVAAVALDRDRITEALAEITRAGGFDGRGIAIIDSPGEQHWIEGILSEAGATIVESDAAELRLHADPLTAGTVPFISPDGGALSAGVPSVAPARASDALATLLALTVIGNLLP